MMTEKQLIGKIRILRQIKPRKEWVFLTKREILGEEKSWLEVFPRIFFQYKPIFASLILLFVLISSFVFAQNSLPGDFLYSLKRITERGQAVFVSEDEKPKVQLELANKRLEELTKIAEENKIKKLAPAIEEYQQTFSQATKITRQIKEPKQVRKIVPEIAKLEKNLENLKSYGIEVGEDGKAEDLYKPIVESLIKDLENRTLTENQIKLLEEAKELYKEGNFALALEKVLEASQIK